MFLDVSAKPHSPGAFFWFFRVFSPLHPPLILAFFGFFRVFWFFSLNLGPP